MKHDDGTALVSENRRGRGVSTVSLEDAERWGGRAGSAVYVKRQRDYCCRPPWRAWRRTPLALREYRALQACAALGLRVPEVVHFEWHATDATLVVAAVPNAQPLNIALTAPADASAAAESRQSVLTNVGQYLGRLHAAGWYHGALYPHHMLVNARNHTLCLIDFEKARRSRRRRREDLARFLRHNDYLSDQDRRTVLEAYAAASRFH